MSPAHLLVGRHGTTSTAAPVSAVVGQIDERDIGLVERVRRRANRDAEPGGQLEEVVAVGPRVRRDTAELPLLEQVAVVVERRDLREVDAGEGQGAAPVEGAQGRRHELAGRREEDRGVEGLGRHAVGRPDRRDAERRVRARVRRPTA